MQRARDEAIQAQAEERQRQEFQIAEAARLQRGIAEQKAQAEAADLRRLSDLCESAGQRPHAWVDRRVCSFGYKTNDGRVQFIRYIGESGGRHYFGVLDVAPYATIIDCATNCDYYRVRSFRNGRIISDATAQAYKTGAAYSMVGDVKAGALPALGMPVCAAEHQFSFLTCAGWDLGRLSDG